MSEGGDASPVPASSIADACVALASAVPPSATAVASRLHARPPLVRRHRLGLVRTPYERAAADVRVPSSTEHDSGPATGVNTITSPQTHALECVLCHLSIDTVCPTERCLNSPILPEVGRLSHHFVPAPLIYKETIYVNACGRCFQPETEETRTGLCTIGCTHHDFTPLRVRGYSLSQLVRMAREQEVSRAMNGIVEED